MSAAPPAPIRVATWNLEWAPRSRRERIAERIALLAPDILCATEADREILPAGGHVAECGADSGYGVKGGRRKVILWSRWPLDDVDPAGPAGLPSGRFVAATARTPLGPLRLVGVCIPWRDAHVRTGGRRGREPWAEHIEYLSALGPLIADRDPLRPMVVLGDFNQRIPRRRAPIPVAEALGEALGDLDVLTRGDVPGIGRQVIDHVACSATVAVGEVVGVDRMDPAGRPLSDHDAVVVTVSALR